MLSNRSSRSSTGKKSFKKSTTTDSDTKESFIEECEIVYLSVLNSLREDISSPEELLKLLQHFGCNPCKNTTEKYWDKNTDSYNFKQFCSIVKQEEKSSKKDLIKVFQKIDKNGDGFITHDELFHVLTKRGERMTKAEVKMMIEDADFNGDGKLDYEEFCDMMEATTKQCAALPKIEASAKGSQVNPNSNRFNRNKLSTNESHSSVVKGSRDLSHQEDQLSFNKRQSFSKSSMKENSPRDNISEQRKSKIMKLKAEPADLMKWQFHSSKGCFYKEENGSIESHHFQLKITQPTSIWITIKAAAPKYGKFNDDILDNDMTVFLVEDNPGSKLIGFTNSIIGGKYSLQANVEIGVYNILTFTSGTKLYIEETDSGQVALVKGTGDDIRLSKACKDTLMEIFYRSDLDGNGFLSREEFNQFLMRSNSEGCDDEAWKVVEESIEVTPQTEITPNGFLNLNLMEAHDPDGGQDELWMTLESMGYSRKLNLSKACPFHLEVFTKKGKNTLSLIGVSDGGEPLRNAMNESVKMVSNIKSIKSKRDLNLHIAEFEQRITLLVENQSHGVIGVSVDCTGSENLESDQGTLEKTEDVKPKSMMVVHHLTPIEKRKTFKLMCRESIVRS